MTPNEFLKTQIEIMRLAQAISNLDISKFLETLLDNQPIVWRPDNSFEKRAKDNMQAVRALSYALLEVQEANKTLKDSLNIASLRDWDRQTFVERLKEIALDFQIEESQSTGELIIHVIDEVLYEAYKFCKEYFLNSKVQFQVFPDLEEYKARAGV